ncbi:MAG: transporter substrate-binding domain-containing protein [Desulfobacula sp.]|nr:transporter substrate-binding domain-containing protein [Desulfobacula sp.]
MYELGPYVSAELENNGFVADIITTAFKRAEYDIDIKFSSWLRCLKLMEKGSKDVMLNMFYTKERAKIYGYPENQLAFLKYVFYVKKDRTDIPEAISLFDLKKLRIGIAKKASYGPEFDAVIDQLPNVYYGLREVHMLQMMIAGRLDIVPSSFYAGIYFLSKKDIGLADKVKRIDSDFFEKKKLFPIFNKQNPDYLKLITDYDFQMEEMTRDGTLEKIYHKHNKRYLGQN